MVLTPRVHHHITALVQGEVAVPLLGSCRAHIGVPNVLWTPSPFNISTGAAEGQASSGSRNCHCQLCFADRKTGWP